jgi:PAP2 superfamily protein
MALWLTASFTYFLYVTAVAILLPRLPRAARVRAMTLAGAGLAFTALAVYARPVRVLDEWLLPPILLLTAYWATGCLFVAPMARAERALWALDHRLGMWTWSARTPRWLATLLELAYAGVYPLIPIALAVHLEYASVPDADRFWSVVLITDYICFGVLPWIQTRPPRALEPAAPWRVPVRRFNLRLLGTASIQVNTFPSGHSAEALAAALFVVDAPWPVAAGMVVTAAAISAGAVLGRYHYAADVLAGWAVALGVWLSL